LVPKHKLTPTPKMSEIRDYPTVGREDWKRRLEFQRLSCTDNIYLVDKWILNNQDYITRPEEEISMVTHCALTNKTQVLEKLLDDGFMPDSSDRNNLLLKASLHGCTKSVVSLLKLGIDPKYKSENGDTPLKVACGGGHYGVVKTLLKIGLSPNIETHEELLIASLNLKNETLRLILECYPKELLGDILTNTLLPAQHSPLQWVVARGSSTQRRADELTKKIADSIIKDNSKSKINDYLKNKERTNTIEI